MDEQQRMPRILIVDDLPSNIKILATVLKEDYQIIVAKDGFEALERAYAAPQPELILLDIVMPEMNGFEVCRRLHNDPKTSNIPVIFVTGQTKETDEALGFEVGGVDYITKPFSRATVKARVRTHVELKRHRDQLEDEVDTRTKALRLAVENLDATRRIIKTAYTEAIFTLTRASEFKDEDTGEHLNRVGLYARELAIVMDLDDDFIDTIFHAAPMHDLGKVGIPDSIQLKPGKLTTEEWEIMKSHTTLGGKILEGSTSPYLKMGQEIAIAHHERWDGTGYPHGLKGEEIPFAARIMNIADQYDSLRSKRPYKPALDHETVFLILTEGDGRTMPGHFDPAVLDAFKQAATKFRDIFTASA